jgi:hypothetical protein
MTLRQLTKESVIAALEAGKDQRFLRFRMLLAEDPRSSFTTTESPAVLLRESLEMKHRVARMRGKNLVGDSELLVALSDLGTEAVSGVFVDSDTEHISLFLRASDLQPIGCVVMTDGTSD